MAASGSKRFIVAVNTFPRSKPVLVSSLSLDEMLTKAKRLLRLGEDAEVNVIIDKGEDAGMEISDDEVLQGIVHATPRLHLSLVPAGIDWVPAEAIVPPNAPQAPPGIVHQLQQMPAGLLTGRIENGEVVLDNVQVEAEDLVQGFVPAGQASSQDLQKTGVLSAMNDVLAECLKQPVQPDIFDVKSRALLKVAKTLCEYLTKQLKDFTLPTTRAYAEALYRHSNYKYKEVFNCVVASSSLNGHAWFVQRLYGMVTYQKNLLGLTKKQGPRSKAVRDHTQPRNRKVRKDYCCPQYLVLRPESEDEASQLRKKLQLQAEFVLGSYPSPQVLVNMEDTFSSQRTDIVKATMEQIKTTVISEWPWLQHAQCLLRHASMLCKPQGCTEEFWDCQAVWDQRIAATSDEMLAYFESFWLKESRKSRPSKQQAEAPAMLGLIAQVKERTNADRSRVVKSICLFPLIATYFMEEMKDFMVVFVEEGSDEDAILEAIKPANENPVLVVKGGLYDEGVQCEVRYLNNLKIEVPDVIQGFLVYHMVFHVYDFCYTVEVQSTLEFMQRYFLDMNQPGDRREKSRRNVSEADSKVLKLAAEIHKFSAPFRHLI